MDVDFEAIVPYLEHPLILVGFSLFLFFSFARFLISKGVIPPLPPGPGAEVLKTVLRYAFILSILIILLGFGLRYRDLSSAEQQRVVRMLSVEFGNNFQVAAELAAGIESTLQNASIVAELLRSDGIAILPIVFPIENLDNLSEARASIPIAENALRALEASGLHNDQAEVDKLRQAGERISATIDRTFPTLLSLADRDRERYTFQREAWESNLDVARRIDVVDITAFQQVYSDLVGLRNDYDVVVDQCLEYLRRVGEFFDNSDTYLATTELASVLASERLAFSLIVRYGSDLATHSEKLVAYQELLESQLPSTVASVESGGS